MINTNQSGPFSITDFQLLLRKFGFKCKIFRFCCSPEITLPVKQSGGKMGSVMEKEMKTEEEKEERREMR